MGKKESYFKGLDGLRFIAAFLVIIHHVEQYKFWAGIENKWGSLTIDHMGHLPVGFFFTLSGFLITYLLLVENRNTQNIDVKFFYWKRIIRIWPLYFVIVFIAIGLFSSVDRAIFTNIPDEPLTNASVIALLLILPNLLRVLNPMLIGGNQLWSIGVEEQFYLFWPLLIRGFRKAIPAFLLSFIAIKLTFNIGLGYSAFTSIHQLVLLFPVEQMAVGASLAWVKFNQKQCSILNSPYWWLAAISLPILVTWLNLTAIVDLSYSFLFITVIHFVTTNNYVQQVLEIPILKYLGKISYGIYMWHTIAITLVILLISYLQLSTVWILPVSALLTLLLSSFSFKFIEAPILRLRNIKWSRSKTIMVKA